MRQLDRQISSQFYERMTLSRNKGALLRKGRQALDADDVTPEEEIKDPLVLEFLGLKDEYSENVLEEALIRRLEHFLLAGTNLPSWAASAGFGSETSGTGLTCFSIIAGFAVSSLSTLRSVASAMPTPGR